MTGRQEDRKTGRLKEKSRLYRIVSYILIMSILITLVTPMPKTHAEATPLSSLPVGARIMFGGRQFAVVNPSDGLVVSLRNVSGEQFDSDGTQIYNPWDTNNIGYYLNNTYYYQFPVTEEGLIKNSTWYIGNQLNETSSSVITRIGLLRESEYNAAKAAGIFPGNGEGTGTDWWLITQYSFESNKVRAVDAAGNPNGTGVSGTYGVRPAFRILESTIFEYDAYSGMYYYPGTLGSDKTLNTLNVGDTLMFHREAWKVVNPSTGLVVADKIDGRRAFDQDNTQTYNPSDGSNIGYYLNNTYYNVLASKEKGIIKNGIWYIGNETNETASSVTAKVGLLRESECNSARTAGIITGSTYDRIWSITPYSGNSTYVRYCYGYWGESATASNLYGVRPALQMLETTVLISVGNGVYRIFADTVPPTSAITYTPSSPHKFGTAVTITATFDEPVADTPVPQISISGANTLANTNMTKTSATVYTYTHTIGAGDGTATVALATAQDLAGNTVTSAPTSGATFTVDNTPPAAPTFEVNPSTKTTGNVTVTINYPGDVATKEYKITDTGIWTDYSVPFTITENYTIFTKCADASGNQNTSASLSVTNIDRTPPSAPTVSPATGTYNTAQMIEVSNTSTDVTYTYYTTDGSDPNITTPTKVTGAQTITIDGDDGDVVILKLVSYDGINLGTEITTATYTFAKNGPGITANPAARAKAPDDISVALTITPGGAEVTNWKYQWDTDQTLDDTKWTDGEMPITTPETITQNTNGTWYLHVRATDNNTNITTQTYGAYKKGTATIDAEYADDTYADERRYFKYYIGLDANDIGRVMLVAPKDAGGVKPIFTRDDILDQATHRFKVSGVYYIDREGKIQEYD
ncbi:MAG TPA: hypothetical protein DCP90_02925 [Clostridiales bacterium]|nr:MAG: hypothetical protein A2Y22_08445 [Clostridiales bacterium GWD2_32_59]HAN09547.1 hypothetical protein [Clostridiales bacterium]